MIQKQGGLTKVFTVDEAAGHLRVSRQTVLRMIESGKLRARKLPGGRLWRIRETDLQKLI